MNREAQESWIEIDDPEISAAQLEARIEERLEQRRAALGPVMRSFPAFQVDRPQDDMAAAGQGRLQSLLDQLALATPPTAAHLAPSPVTRLPVVGRLWSLLRGQTHELVLFYVNRHLAHQAKVNHAIERALRELSALLAQQDARIDELQARLDELDRSGEQNDG